VLGLSVGAPYADVRAAYKQLAARWHPDKLALQDKEGQGDGGDRFISIQSAYQQLVEHLQQSA
jgi:DnaJ-class molecular chaperone